MTALHQRSIHSRPRQPHPLPMPRELVSQSTMQRAHKENLYIHKGTHSVYIISLHFINWGRKQNSKEAPWNTPEPLLSSLHLLCPLRSKIAHTHRQKQFFICITVYSIGGGGRERGDLNENGRLPNDIYIYIYITLSSLQSKAFSKRSGKPIILYALSTPSLIKFPTCCL